MHKFEKLEVWQLAIEYTDVCYSLAEQLPKHEDYNLASASCYFGCFEH